MQYFSQISVSRNAKQRGFTLIELLIASGVMVIILGIIAQSFRWGGQEVTRSFAITDISEDTRLSGQLIADEVARAVYVYPPGTNITLGSGYTTRKPSIIYKSDGTTVASTTPLNIWTVGTDPILAMLVAPTTVGACDVTTTIESNCLYFVAYYPVERSGVVSNSSGAFNPGADPLNSSNWVLFELRSRVDSPSLATSTGSAYNLPALSYTGSALSGYILADHIDAGGFKINFGATATDTFCRNKEGSSVNCNTTPGLSLDALATVNRGNFSIQSAIARGNLPNKVKSQRYDYAIGPRNLYPKL